MFDTRGSSAYHVACSQGHFEVAKYIFGLRPGFVRLVVSGNISAMYAACYNGHLNVAKYLAYVRADLLDMCNDRGISALYVACQNGHLEKATSECDIVLLHEFSQTVKQLMLSLDE